MTLCAVIVVGLWMSFCSRCDVGLPDEPTEVQEQAVEP